jgi:hypothetical protein
MTGPVMFGRAAAIDKSSGARQRWPTDRRSGNILLPIARLVRREEEAEILHFAVGRLAK